MEPITFGLGNLSLWGILWVIIQAILLSGFVCIAFVMIALATPKFEKKIFPQNKTVTLDGISQKIPETPQKIKIGRALLALIALIWISAITIPQIFDFHHVTIESNGVWKLKTRWGLTVGTLAPTEKRNIEIATIETKMSRYPTMRNSVIVISTDTKAYKSVYSTNTTLKKVENELRTQAQKQEVLSKNSTELKLYRNIIHFVSIGLIFFVGWWFWKK